MPTLVVGTGSHTYDVVQDFAILPPGMSFGHTNDVAVDSHGTVYVTQRGGPPILAFDASGAYQGALGEGLLADPSGICTTADDHIVVADRDTHQVLKLDAQGTVLVRLGEAGVAKLHAPFNHPSGVAVAPNGDILVADGFGNSCVHRFSADGQLLRSWGSPGAAPGQLSSPTASGWTARTACTWRTETTSGSRSSTARAASWPNGETSPGPWPYGETVRGASTCRTRCPGSRSSPRRASSSPRQDARSRAGHVRRRPGNLYFTGAISGVTGDFSGVAKLAART